MENSKFLFGVGLVALGLGTMSTTGVQAQKARPSMARAITLTGIVGGAPMGKEFFLRANGETFRVQPLVKVGMSGIRGGDRVRVFGRPTGLLISHANVRVLSSRASDNPSDYNPAPGTTIQTQPSRRTGGPARSTTNQNPQPQSNQGMQNQGMSMPNNGNQQFVNPLNTGVVTPGVVIPNVAASNAVRSNIIKQSQAK